MTFDYTVKDALTKDNLAGDADTGVYSVVAGKGNTVGTIPTPTVTTSSGGSSEEDPSTETDVVVTLNVDDNITEVKYASVASDAEAPANNAYQAATISEEDGSKTATCTIEAGQKLYLKITAKTGYTAEITGKMIGADGVCAYGVINANETITISAKEENSVED